MDPEAALLMAESRFALAREYHAPLAGRETATLEIVRGATHLTVDGSALADRLFDARFADLVAAVVVKDDVVRVEYQHHGGRGRSASGDGTIALNPSVAWTIIVRGGLARVRLRLSEVPLAAIRAVGGLSDVEVSLPRLERPAAIAVIGGLHQVRIVRPGGVPMRFGLHGGAAHVTFDRETFDAVGSALECTSDGFDANGPGFDLQVTGGASHLTIGVAEAPEL